ncbi:hypothetical protein BS78_02G302000 [Paspalum vaginatum]|nr:hypothetical protein BS78_02G302000 [Paspalum vaginatum]
MALTRLFLVVLLSITMPLVFFSRAAEAGGAAGVSYGTIANNLPKEASVVDLLRQNGITVIRIYDASPEVLTPLANTGIKVVVMMPNKYLTAAAASPSYALQWVKTNVTAYYPATQINGVAVGNEVFNTNPEFNSVLVPAMTNVQAALAQLGLADAVKVSTPVAFDAIQYSYPPSAATFKGALVPVMKPMLDFLQRTGSYLSINLYPFLTYTAQPGNISLDYALGNSKDGVRDPNTGLVYHSLLDAELDATYFAMEKLMTGSSSSATAATEAIGAREGLGDSMATNKGMRVTVTETGWPSGGGPHRGRAQMTLEAAADGAPAAATVANAQAYNNYVINRVLSGDTGTPHRPDADMDVYIFALFNEDLKKTGPDDTTERHFGLFYPNETKVYPFDFRGGGGGAPTTTESWCVADASADEDLLEEEMGYACDSADCSAIEPGGECFDPDTIVAHASYAFNSYYQCNDRASGSCDFDGAACVVYQQPKFGNCVLPSNNLKE